MTVQALRIEEIGEVVRRRTGRAAGVSAVAVGGDLDHVRVDIEAARPGVVHGHGSAEAGRLRASHAGDAAITPDLVRVVVRLAAVGASRR